VGPVPVLVLGAGLAADRNCRGPSQGLQVAVGLADPLPVQLDPKKKGTCHYS